MRQGWRWTGTPSIATPIGPERWQIRFKPFCTPSSLSFGDHAQSRATKGTKLKVFHLVAEAWQRLWAVLEQRQARRTLREESGGSPPSSNDSKPGGDPTAPDPETWFGAECLADVQQMWESSQFDPQKLADLRQQVPEPVLRHLGLAS